MMASWFPFIREDSACSSLYSWSGASWHQQAQLLRLRDTVVISILFFLLPTCHCSMGTRKSHAVVVSVQYLYWASLVACAKGYQCYRDFLLFSPAMCTDWFVPVLFTLFTIQFFISMTVFSCKTSCISLCQCLWRSLLLFLLLSGINYRAEHLTKPSRFLFTLLPVQWTELSLVQRINTRYLIDI